MAELQVFAVKYALDQPGVAPDPEYLGYAETEALARQLGADHFEVEATYVRAWKDKDRHDEWCFYVDCPDRQDEEYDNGSSALGMT